MGMSYFEIQKHLSPIEDLLRSSNDDFFQNYSSKDDDHNDHVPVLCNPSL